MRRRDLIVILLAVGLAISVAANIGVYFGVVRPLQDRLKEAQEPSLSLWRVGQDPEEYRGTREVALTLLAFSEMHAPGSGKVFHKARVRDSYGYEVEFYLSSAQVDAFGSQVGESTMFRISDSISSSPLHGVAPGEPTLGVLVNEQRSDSMWDTVIIEFI